MTSFNARLRLRRDNDYNYKKIETSFIPSSGEVCLIDTARNGLRAKIGDGVSTFDKIKFVDEDIAMNIIIYGYLKENQFYSDAEFTNLINASVNKIYIDVAKNSIYIYNGSVYLPVTQTISAATDSAAGVMKLYNTLGQNTDGTITQKTITDELNEKFEVEVDLADEEIIFSRNL